MGTFLGGVRLVEIGVCNRYIVNCQVLYYGDIVIDATQRPFSHGENHEVLTQCKLVSVVVGLYSCSVDPRHTDVWWLEHLAGQWFENGSCSGSLMMSLPPNIQNRVLMTAAIGNYSPTADCWTVETAFLLPCQAQGVAFGSMSIGKVLDPDPQHLLE